MTTATTSCIAQILENDPMRKELRFGDVPEVYCHNVTELVEALQRNTVIEYVRMDRLFLPGLNAQDKTLLLQQIGKLPALQEVHLYAATLPLTDLTALLTNAVHLKWIHLEHVRLEKQGGNADTDDMIDFEYSLFRHASLEKFHLIDFNVTIQGIPVATEIDGLLRALSTVPNLTSLKIQASKLENITFDASSIAAHCNSTTLKELHLSRVALKPLHVRLIAFGMRCRSSLRVLSLPRTHLQDADVKKLAATLKQQTCLEQIDLSANADITDEGCMALAEGLSANTTVRNVRLWGCHNIGSTGIAAFAKMLDQNSTLVRLQIPLCDDSKACVVHQIDSHLNKNRGSSEPEKRTTAMAA